MSDPGSPSDLRYHREHDWVRLDGDEAVLGVTWFAQDALGEVVYYEAPAVGSEINADTPYGVLESIKAVSDLVAPVTGTVVAVNTAVAASPETVNADPYGEGWLIRVRLSNTAQVDALLDSAAYDAYVSGLA